MRPLEKAVVGSGPASPAQQPAGSSRLPSYLYGTSNKMGFFCSFFVFWRNWDLGLLWGGGRGG